MSAESGRAGPGAAKSATAPAAGGRALAFNACCMIERRDFLYTLGVAGLSPALVGATAAAEPEVQPLERALVLSGGGARGSYEAGIIGGLAAAAGRERRHAVRTVRDRVRHVDRRAQRLVRRDGPVLEAPRHVVRDQRGQELMRPKPQYAAAARSGERPFQSRRFGGRMSVW